MKLIDHKDLEVAYQCGNYQDVLDSIGSMGYTHETSEYFYYFVGSNIELGNLNKAEFLLHEYEPNDITPENVIIWHFLKGKYFNALSEPNLAINELELALKFCPKKKKSIMRAEINLELAIALRGIEKHYLALNVAQQAFLGIKSTDNKSIIAHTSNVLGLLHLEIKDYNKARNYLKNALTIYEEINHQHGKGKTLFHLSLLFKRQNQNQEALYLGERAFSIFQKLGNLYNVVCSSIALGEIYFSLNQPLEAGKHLKNAQILSEKIGNSQYVAQSLLHLGKVFKNQKKYKESLQYFHKALTLLELNNESEILAVTLYNTGIIFQIQDNFQDALQVFTRALRLREQIGDHEAIAKVLLKLSEIKFQIGMKKESLQILRDVQTILKPTSNIRLKLSALFQFCKFKYLMNILDSNFLLIENNSFVNTDEESSPEYKYKILIKSVYNLSLNDSNKAVQQLNTYLDYNDYTINETNFIYKLLSTISLEIWIKSKTPRKLENFIKVLDKWEEYCEQRNLGDNLLKICLLRGRISIIIGDITDAERRFVQCSLTSEEMGLLKLKKEIDFEIEFLNINKSQINSDMLKKYESIYLEKVTDFLSF
ncbi:MAG: tetratricopeptide repeat protein [Candidatus Hodarchaeales archaeon]|jgi:tetratricopeptide (TPR) repeat protein